MSALGTQSGRVARADWRRDLVAVPAPQDRPRPRWTEAVGASVLLSVLDSLDQQDETASA
ncbi:hypothetical protein [Actinomycetospora atypica]|uniref:Uncharacterized protein n=1 Tax=Actinomycetospora atypica TaxID=1290095 RepID=A0ABV9YG32_9PSEU